MAQTGPVALRAQVPLLPSGTLRHAVAKGFQVVSSAALHGTPLRELGAESQHWQGVRRVGVWHRTLATYLNTLLEHGFVVARLAEPRPNEAVAALHPGRAEVPLLLLVHATRPP